MGRRTNGSSDQWVVGLMGRRTNGPSDYRAVALLFYQYYIVHSLFFQLRLGLLAFYNLYSVKLNDLDLLCFHRAG